MPIEKDGRITLSWGKGNLCWLCIILYMCFWGGIGVLLHEFVHPYLIWVGILGQGSFGLVSMVFFAHEELKCKKVVKDIITNETL